jgi:uncharacterized protein YdhG (YjbR/CyaY superfamily)
VTAAEVDAYLAAVLEPGRATLQQVRATILRLEPEVEQGISYGMPAFRLGGKTVAGLAAFRRHLAYLPHSGSVLSELGQELEGYTSTTGSLHFALDTPLPEPLVARLLEVRKRQLGLA